MRRKRRKLTKDITGKNKPGYPKTLMPKSDLFSVVRCLVRRYVTDEQRKSQDFNITEDDINEVYKFITEFLN